VNGLILLLPSTVDPLAVARLVAPTSEVQWPTADDPRAVVLGSHNVYIEPLDAPDIAAAELPPLTAERMGPLNYIGLFSADFSRIADVLRPVVAAWPCLIDDDDGHLFDGKVFGEWLARHASPTWSDVSAGALLEMPTI
jgi:hypothetical protein